MKRKMLQKLLAHTMCTVFIINGLTVTKVDAETTLQNKVSVVLPNLNPVPQNVEIKDDALTITTSVNIEGYDVADEDAIRVLNQFLEANNITINESYDENSTTLIIGEVEDEIKEMDEFKTKVNCKEAADLSQEGYVLVVDSTEGNNGTILIEGKDGDGTFYGVQTLTQLAVNNNAEVIANDVVISDEPSMKTRGTVEGFYGNPWTHQDRLDQIEFYGKNKLNTYIYAPKDDVYHRTKWREPYPQSEMARMQELINKSSENKVDFVFALSPGIDISFDGDKGESDFQSLITKCESLYNMGVRSFAILFDDISNKDGVKQAELLNRFNNEFVKAKGDVKPLITVPTEYDTFAMSKGGETSQYTSDFSSTLDSDIMVMWTGGVVVPEGLDLENANLVNSIYGKRMGIWWNYPVTDYMKEKLALGPIYNVDTALEGEIDFFTMNPMEHANMSKITLATGADYSWNTSEYDYDASWRKAIEMEFGDLASEMLTFANHSTRLSSTGREDAPEVKALISKAIEKLAKGEDSTVEINALTTEFNNMILAADKLKASLPADTLAECSSNLDKLKLLGENSKLALDLLVAESQSKSEEVTRIKALINGNMSKLTSGSKVSEDATLAFIKEAVSVGLKPMANFDISDTFVLPGETVTFNNTSSISSAEFEWIFEGANIESSIDANPIVTYANEGVYSVTLVAKNVLGESKVVKKGVVTVSNEANKERTNLALNKTVTASGYTNSSEAPKFAVDGNSGTKWCSVGSTPHTLIIDLGKVTTITNVVIKHAGAGGEGISANTRDYRLQVSEDGQNYVEVAKVTGNESNITNDKIKVSNARYVKLLVDKPTQTTDSATRIFEVEVMGVNEDIDLPPEYVGEVKDPIIYPVPQNIKYISEEGMSLSGEVNVVIHGDQEESTVPKLEEILKENNIKYSIGAEIDDTKANIVITSDKEHCDNCADDAVLKDAALNNKEGYVIKATDDVNKKGSISIVASDKDGAYYGVLSLGQLLEKEENGKIAEVVISDYPEIDFRGFIEGFYGTPWSHEDRISLMKDTSEYKMNTYIYAPKDDPYHRKQWKDLYPEAEANQIKELAEAGKENNMNFCWTIHPGATLKFTDADYQALINKFEQLYSLGVRQFGVLFDDTDDWTNGKKQAEWINKIDTEFVKVKGDVAPMIVISARYNSAWGPSMSSYFKPFMQTLNKDIQVMWTGHATMSNVSRDVFEWPKTQTGVDKDVAVWWNYPVNDYCDSRLLMAPLHNLNPDLDNVSGFFSNPMNQAEASKVALYSIADYTWNTDEFNYMDSWETSIEKLVPEVKEEFMRFAANTSYLKDNGGASGSFEYDESWYLTNKINKLKDAITKNESVVTAAKDLLTEFELIVSDYNTIVNKVENENLLSEVKVFLDSYNALGQAGIAAMNSIIYAEEGNIEQWLNNNNLAKSSLALMDTFKVKRMEDNAGNMVEVEYVVAVGEKRLKPLVKEIMLASNNIVSKAIFKEISPEIITSLSGLDDVEIAFNNGVYSINEVGSINLEAGGYIGIALPKATKLSEVVFEASDYDGLELQYSLNGIEWSKAETTISNSIMKTSSSLSATYVRVINTSASIKAIDISKLETKPVYKANPTISQNIGQYQNYSINNALDGNMNTKYWSDKASGAGHNITLDLGNAMPLYDVTAYFGNMDYMRNSEYQISADGINWTSLGELQYTTQGDKKLATVNAEGKMARYIRIKANGENSGYWVQLFEIEFNKTVPDYGSDYVELVTGSLKGKVDALYDMNLGTAFEATSIEDGDYLTYKMTRITNVGDIAFLQDANNISEAKVSVKNSNGDWKDVGVLGKQLTTLSIDEEILEVKLEFNADKPAPKLYEVIVNKRERFEQAYKGHLEIAVEVANEISYEELDKVVPVVANEFRQALAEAIKILNDSRATQEEVNKSWERLSDIMHKLSFFKGDKTRLLSLIERVNILKGDEFITDTWNKLQAALQEANVVVEDVNALEKEVSESYDKLIRAYLNLRLKPSKDKLKDLINKAEALEVDKYTEKSYKAVEKALVSAKMIFKDEKSTEKEIAKAESALEIALNNLVQKAENNSGNNQNNNSNNSSNNNNSENNSNNSEENSENNNGNANGNKGNVSENNSGKLPSTGGRSAGIVGLFGAITAAFGFVINKKKK